MEGNIRDCANQSQSNLSLSRHEVPQDEDPRRRLLLIYIHGFMGSEASFHDLPAHVHDLLTGSLAETHVVYTRMYPRYKSQGEIQTAVNQFSTWLSPHEADDLDVVLLGHSLGGILAADVARLETDGRAKHRILGVVGFDVPFLGIHPRVVPTGTLGSMPKKGPATEELAGAQESLGLDTPFKPATSNPNFDPPFMNDVRLVERGFLKGIMHFVNKNENNLTRSIIDRVVSPLKFAGCVNNYSELRRRYRHLMDLEAAESSPERVRFVNYYTASTGHPKKEKKKKPPKEPKEKKEKKEKKSKKPKGSTEGGDVKDSEEPTEDAEGTDQINETTEVLSRESEVSNNSPQPSQVPSLDTLSLEAQPIKPTSSHISRTSAETEKASDEKPERSDEIDATFSGTDEPKDTQSLSESLSITESASITPSESADPSAQHLRKFILLPSHHWKYNDNSHWVPIVMENMDEVEAHQSMFIPHGANYDHLIGDSVALVEQWIENDLTRRALHEGLD
ncbi:unnamed protein product [Penicillium salamii]|uniref:AB hydrolase-1 domain-containing protein n=1 Tax=Penicillium salamii TaxID=1612424 RepID=A0A9W4NNT2_9EURO|nr:unnamed protein product [Penicillium salamii]CAG8238522.1 unnamed protein product [Penicillium salamii]CAG8321076.1 unnamed protein product [Penicillium salamii]CAG8363496.1 unnamed protein product [Penicillium salamii]CAG8388384.1 unnamed protein product [Penicillium salamii]